MRAKNYQPCDKVPLLLRVLIKKRTIISLHSDHQYIGVLSMTSIKKRYTKNQKDRCYCGRPCRHYSSSAFNRTRPNPSGIGKRRSCGSAMLEWGGHVPVFSPWKYATDKALVALLEKQGWQHPDKKQLPKRREIVEQYLKPVAEMLMQNQSRNISLR